MGGEQFVNYMCFTHAEITQRLLDIAKREHIKILLAVEAGSRVWGIESIDSDWDIRFIYVRHFEHYLNLGAPRDVIEINDGNFDAAGWDLDKALRLFKKSNPPLLEWLRSDIVYLKDDWFHNSLINLLPSYYNRKAMCYHYLHMANNNWKEYLHGDVVWLKKYFYVLRPLLSVLWLEYNEGLLGYYPPLDFYDLVGQTVPFGDVLTDIANLTSSKKAGAELDRGQRIDSISEFIEREMPPLLEKNFTGDRPETSWGQLNNLFLDTLNRYGELSYDKVVGE